MLPSLLHFTPSRRENDSNRMIGTVLRLQDWSSHEARKLLASILGQSIFRIIQRPEVGSGHLQGPSMHAQRHQEINWL